MDVKQIVSDMISLGGLGGLATLIGTIWAIIHGHKKDERQDDEDRRELEMFELFPFVLCQAATWDTVFSDVRIASCSIDWGRIESFLATNFFGT